MRRAVNLIQHTRGQAKHFAIQMNIVHREGDSASAIIGDVRRTSAIQRNARNRTKHGRIRQGNLQHQLWQNGCVEDGWMTCSKEGVPVINAKLRAISSRGVRLVICAGDGSRRYGTIATA